MAELTKGTLIGPWEIVDVLGSGAFGITYRAQHYMSALRDRARMQVAIKELFLSDVLTRRDNGSVTVRTGASALYRRERELFIDEAARLASIVHPNIVVIRDVIEANNTCYIVMDLADGPNLSKRVRPKKGMSEPLSVEEWRPMLVALLSALDTMHRLDPPLLHRDIKPANIGTMQVDGRPVLLDFGAARQLFAERSQKLTAVLTKGYAPYEQYNLSDDELEDEYEAEVASAFTTRSLPKQGPATDIYSLAATSHFALTGRAPVDSLLRKVHGQLQPPLIDRIDGDRSLLASIDKALSLEPEDRFQSAAEWLEALGKPAPWAPVVSRIAPAASPPRATPPPSAETTPEQSGSGTSIAWFAIAVLAFGALLIWFQMSSDERAAREDYNGRQEEMTAEADAMTAEEPMDAGAMETPAAM